MASLFIYYVYNIRNIFKTFVMLQVTTILKRKKNITIIKEHQFIIIIGSHVAFINSIIMKMYNLPITTNNQNINQKRLRIKYILGIEYLFIMLYYLKEAKSFTTSLFKKKLWDYEKNRHFIQRGETFPLHFFLFASLWCVNLTIRNKSYIIYWII